MQETESDIVVWKLLAVIILAVFDLVGTIPPMFYTSWFLVSSDRFSRMVCFSSGLILGSAIVQMLSESENQFYSSGISTGGIPVTHFLCALGFCSAMILQWLSERIKQRTEDSELGSIELVSINPGEMEDDSHDIKERNDRLTESPVIFLVVVLIQSSLDSFAVGFQEKSSGVIVLAISIGIANWIEGSILVLGFMCYRRYKTKRCLFTVAFLFTITDVISCLLASLVSLEEDHSAVMEAFISGLVSFVSGSLVYISCVDMLSRQIIATREHPHHFGLTKILTKSLFFVFGFGLVTLIVFLEDAYQKQ